MKFNHKVIPLGLASKETRGPFGMMPDEQNGQSQAGILKD